jgi:putative membrane protein
MTLDALLAYLHFAAILTAVVFVASQAALCRPEWVNPAVVHRLVRVNTIYLAALVLILLSGAARAQWGLKGPGWTWVQPLLHVKLALTLAMLVMAAGPTRRYARWRQQLEGNGALPDEAEIRATRRSVMIASHLMLIIPLAAVLLARGLLTR